MLSYQESTRLECQRVKSFFKVSFLFCFLQFFIVNFSYACQADAGSLNSVNPHIEWTGNPVIVAAIPGVAVVPSGFLKTYVLTEGPNLVIQQTAPFPSFNVSMQGTYRIHTLVYDPNTLDLTIVVPGVTTGFDVNALLIQGGGTICASLDVAGAKSLVSTCIADAGALTIDDPLVLSQTGSGLLSATPDGNSNVPAGYQTLFLLSSGSNLVIQQTSSLPQFTVAQYGEYTIHTFVFDPSTYDLSTIIPFQTTGSDIASDLFPNGGTICGSIDAVGAPVVVAECGVFAGTVTITNVDRYLVNGASTIKAIADGNALIPNSYSTAYLLSFGNNFTVEQINTTPDFTVTQEGYYRIHSFVYDPATFNLSSIILGTTTTIDLFYQTYSGGGTVCADLDVFSKFAEIEACDADAGTLTTWEQVTIFNGVQSIVSGLPDGNVSIPVGFQMMFVLTEGPNKVLKQTGVTPSFTVDSVGVYHIHTLVYDPLTFDLAFLIPGVTTGFHLDIYLIQGGGAICGSFDLTGTQTIVTECPAYAGNLLIDASTVPILNGTADISATPVGNAVVPAGFQTVYVLTDGPQNYIILQTSTTPSFTVTQTGNYIIHTLIYDPTTLDLTTVIPGVTSALSVNSQLVQGGGLTCGSLDVTGAPAVVFDCVADAGTLTADSSNIVLINGMTTLSATPSGNAVVPAGYQTTYLLTSGTGLVIEQGNNLPIFTVNQNGDYTIHTLVFDPNTLDLSIVVPGVTTGFDVNALLIQGGGAICASLDVFGAPIIVADCIADAGTITIDFPIVLLKSNTATVSGTPDGNAFVPTGYQTTYLLSQGTGLVIQQGNNIPEFTVNQVGNYTIHTIVYNSGTFDITTIVPGVTTGFDVEASLIQGGGLICGSLDVVGAPVLVSTCEAFAGTSTPVQQYVTFNGTSATIAATPDGNSNIPPGYQLTYLLTEGAGLVAQSISTTPSFSVTSTGDYTIHAFVYNPTTYNLSTIIPGVTTGVDINAQLVQGGGSVCASLDVAGAKIQVGNCVAFAGTITANDSLVTLTGGSVTIGATPDGNGIVPAGYLSEFILTLGPNLVIQQTSSTFPIFSVSQPGDYTIHTLVYNPNSLDLSTIVLGTTTGFDVNALLIQGGGTICGSLDVPGAEVSVVSPSNCTANAGTITINDPYVELLNGFAVVAASPDGNAVVPQGYQIGYVLTTGTNFVIEQFFTSPSFSVTLIGDYTIHALVYDPNTLDLNTIVFGTTTALDVNSQLIQGGGTICASLDLAGALANVSVCPAKAGTMTSNQDTVLLVNGSNNVVATPDGNEIVPPGYEILYLLSQGAGLVVIQSSNLLPIFTVTQPDQYTIHTFVFNPSTFNPSSIINGTTTISDLEMQLIQGGGAVCGGIDVGGAFITVINPSCAAEAGSITATQTPVVLSAGTASIGGTLDGNQVIPNGYQVSYLLSKGPGLIIEQISSVALFTVTTTGNYIIHALVYDPTTFDLTTIVTGSTTANTVEMTLIQGGGNICGAIDIAGAPITVNAPTACTADAGTITASQSPVVLSNNGTATISAAPDGNQVVPTGYETTYVLTMGTGLVIEQVSMAASFTVSNAGNYTIHTLVYDPNTLDLSTIVFGTTTGFDVYALLIQGGGTICGSLDVQGAAIVVNNPAGCTADAGTLTAGPTPVVLSSGSATITATLDGNQVVPTGYQQVSLLTLNSIVESGNNIPQFTVTAAGTYTIHTFVYDPTTFDLTTVVLGTTTVSDVESQLIQGGGTICASLDVQGASIVVNNPVVCTADAGTITASQSPVVLSSGVATISGIPDGNQVVPTGYQTAYVLTKGVGLVIEQISTTPSFTVNSVGDYVIHTLIFDSNTLDLSTVVPGTTTASDVENLLIQGGGTICGSLDTSGAPITVNNAPSCAADPGTMTINQTPVVLVGGAANVGATPDGNVVIPSGFQSLFILSNGMNSVIQQTGSFLPIFSVSAAGNYAIHTLIYDPSTFNPGTIANGATTINDLNVQFIQGGGSICAGLDVTGTLVTVTSCTANAGTITANQSPVILSGASVAIGATPDGNQVVPSGYQTAYVLTSGATSVIEQISTFNTVFTVTSTGSYAIHTLVYDPNTLDVSTIVLGSTTAGDVHALLIQGGGTICGALDLTGAPIAVTSPCSANAGTITIVQSPVTISNGTAVVTANPDGNAIVPPGFQTMYLLSKSTNYVIRQMGTTPSFTVDSIGFYTIHTLIYNPSTYNPSTIVLGSTTGATIEALFIQGGGAICGSLDVAGAGVNVIDCAAEAGTMTANNTTVVISGGSANIGGTPDNNAVVPAGFFTRYILTSGSNQVVEQISGFISLFTVNQTGLYTIHTLVFNPNTYDVTTIVPGVTTGLDIASSFISGGGTVCGDFDIVGAEITVAPALQLVKSQIEVAVSLYPNPATSYVLINSTGLTRDQPYVFEIMDNLGKIQYSGTLYSDEEVRLPVNDLVKGAYYFRLNTGKEIIAKRIIVQ